jgi:hypothetical protein
MRTLGGKVVRDEPARRGGSFPGAAQVSGERPGEAELGVAGDDQPGPPVRGLRVTEPRGGPSQNLLEQAESVFKVEAAQERLPQPVHLIGGCAGAREPQPYGLGVAVAGQVIYRQPDQGSLDDR